MLYVYIICAVLFFGILIGIHEFGHFFTAKLCGVKVNEFAIGMGPLLWQRQGKETSYSLRLLPIGGFCAMEGEDEASDDPRAFSSAPRWKRFLILIAGAGMNFLLGLLIVLCLFAGTVHASTTIVSFAPGCPAAEYLQAGDQILKIDGKTVLVESDITTLLSRGNGESADLVVRREGQRMTLERVPIYLAEYTDNGATSLRYGINFAWASGGLWSNLGYGVRQCLDFVRLVWYGLEDLVTGAAGLSDMSGPIGIVDTMSEVGTASATVWEAVLNLLYLGAFIAVNLAVMNLLPIPALDGGRLFFLLLNALLCLLFRRQIPEKYESWVHMIGLALLLGLMVLVGVNDVLRIIRR